MKIWILVSGFQRSAWLKVFVSVESVESGVELSDALTAIERCQCGYRRPVNSRRASGQKQSRALWTTKCDALRLLPVSPSSQPKLNVQTASRSQDVR